MDNPLELSLLGNITKPTDLQERTLGTLGNTLEHLSASECWTIRTYQNPDFTHISFWHKKRLVYHIAFGWGQCEVRGRQAIETFIFKQAVFPGHTPDEKANSDVVAGAASFGWGNQSVCVPVRGFS